MITIWKFRLRLTGEQTLALPRGAQILSVQDQGGSICIWVSVDTQAEPELRHFYIFETGYPIENIALKRFVGTVQQDSLVWHVFEGN